MVVMATVTSRLKLPTVTHVMHGINNKAIINFAFVLVMEVKIKIL